MIKVCQSCGMPMNKDPKGGGTEKDGSKSEKYCSYCYENGEFKNEYKNSSEMIIAISKTMYNKKPPRFMVKLFAKRLNKLERWKK